MKKQTQTEAIANLINEDTCAVQIIKNHKNPKQASIITSGTFFTQGCEIEYTDDLIDKVKDAISQDTIIIMFNDIELSEAWKQSYLKSGITEDGFDRRVEFHPYNELYEVVCIDQTLFWDITDYFKGTDHELTEEKCSWRWNIIKWYKNHLIN